MNLDANDVIQLLDAMDDLTEALVKGVKSRPLSTVNYDGSDCRTVGELAATNRCTQTKAAVWAALNSDGVLRRSGIDYVKSLHASGNTNSNGVMLCFVPNQDSRRQLTVEDGEPADQIHCTLYYAGNTDGDEQVSGAMITRLKEIGHQLSLSIGAPFSVRANGIARFTSDESDNPQDAVVVTIDSPRLPPIYSRMASMLFGDDELGFRKPDHGYTPHITVGYVNAEDHMPISRWDSRTIQFVAVELWVGGVITSWPLGATPPFEAGMYDEPEGEKGTGDEDVEPAIPVSGDVPLRKDVYTGEGSFPRRRRRTSKKIIQRARGMMSAPREQKQ